jgi:peptidoglycan/LPS O-acetylase OafA/YrhL
MLWFTLAPVAAPVQPIFYNNRTTMQSGTTAAAPRPYHRNNEIEVLRAFAILFTVVLHLKLLLPAGNELKGWLGQLDLSIGVDLFLVISGYVITGSVVNAKEHYAGPTSALIFAFWVKRIYRLWPSAWTWVMVAVVSQLCLAVFTDLAFAPGDIAWQAATALLNLMNLYTPHCVATGNGLPCIFDNFLGHYWSLSLEEQFYILFPLLFFFLPRRVFVGALVVAILLQSMWTRPFFTYAWYFKTEALCWGILLALLQQLPVYSRVYSSRYLPRLLLQVGGLALVFSSPVWAAMVQGIGYDMKPYGVALVALMCATLVWLASLERGAFQFGSAIERVMLWFASRSYSMYLVHLIVFLTVRDGFAAAGFDLVYAADNDLAAIATVVTALGLTAILTELNYRFVESGLRDRGRELANRRLRLAEKS